MFYSTVSTFCFISLQLQKKLGFKHQNYKNWAILASFVMQNCCSSLQIALRRGFVLRARFRNVLFSALLFRAIFMTQSVWIERCKRDHYAFWTVSINIQMVYDPLQFNYCDEITLVLQRWQTTCSWAGFLDGSFKLYYGCKSFLARMFLRADIDANKLEKFIQILHRAPHTVPEALWIRVYDRIISISVLLLKYWFPDPWSIIRLLKTASRQNFSILALNRYPHFRQLS